MLKAIAEAVFGDLGKPPQLQYASLTLDLAMCLRPGAVLFVEVLLVQSITRFPLMPSSRCHATQTPYLEEFFTKIHPAIPEPYVLISGDSDLTNPGEWRHMLLEPKVGQQAMNTPGAQEPSALLSLRGIDSSLVWHEQ